MPVTEHSERVALAPGATDGSPRRFRAQTVEEALRQAREVLGDDASIIEANRVRRGGIGGFFATELGVEVLVVPGDGEGRRPVGAASAKDDESVATRTGFADAPAPSPRRARQSWRNAAREHGDGPDGRHDQQVVPGLSAMLDRAEASERAAVAAMRTDARHEAPTGSGDTGAAGADTGTFAEHFLRELIEGASTLRRPEDRPHGGPLDGHLDDAVALDETSSEAFAALDAATDGMTSRAATRNRALPEAKSSGSSRLSGLASPSAGPLGTPAVLGSAGSRLAALATEPVAPEPESAEPAADGPVPRPTPMLRGRPRQLVLGEAEDAPSGDGPVEPAASRAAAPGTATPDAATPEPTAAATGDAIGDLVERCLQFGAGASTTNAPRKVALAVTMQDGAVMKLTLELQPPAPKKPARTKPTATKRAAR